MKTYSNSWRRVGGSTLIVVALAAMGWLIWRYGERIGLVEDRDKVLAFLLLSVIVLILRFAPKLLAHVKRQQHQEQGVATGIRPASDGTLPPSSKRASPKQEIPGQLQAQYGHFWKRKVRLLLVVGEPEQVEAVAPGLTKQLWLEGQDTVLVHGGSLKGQWQIDVTALLKSLRRSRPVDGIVWALTEAQGSDVASLSTGVRQLRDLSQALRWQAPLYLWQVCSSGWVQEGREGQAVGCLLPANVTAEQIEASLRKLVVPLRERGMGQIAGHASHDFLLRLSRDMGRSGIGQWRQALSPFLAQLNRSVPLRGLLFSPKLAGIATGTPNAWWPEASWSAVLGDKQSRGGRLAWSWARGCYIAGLAFASLCALALLLSFASNRSQIATVESALATINTPGDADAQLKALHELTREMARLDYRREHGEPWYQRFGLSQNDALLAVLWPRYTEANNRLLRDVATQHLEQQLTELADLPADSPERASRAEEAHAQLKAYLMMARPEKADAEFLGKLLTREEAARPGVTPGLWQDLSPNLWAFYAQHLAAHPEWRTQTQPGLVSQARQVLLGQLGQRNGVANLYQQVLDRASNNYAALTLRDMVGETDAPMLFDTPNSVPGVFTRQAWEGQVRQAIDEVAEARREAIDWVLSDQQSTLDSDLKPEVLKAQLTERYFQEFSDAWLAFLNSTRWRKADSLSDAIAQLTLLSDVRQSPLIALMNTLAYQGKTEVKGEALSDSLMKSAQQLLDKDKQPVIDQNAAGPRGPLDTTFGPILALLGKEKSATATGDNLSLQAFLTRVTRVRLKLQQVTNAANPQAMTQALAQTVFQGTSVDLTDTLDYGSLIAASLGGEWSGFGQNLFVQPLNQAWEGVLQPSAAGLNRQWQRAIVGNWERAFDGRYPFAVSGSDASLPMLGQMIRSGTGRIDQFISSQLGGVLHKEGNRWVPDSGNSQGLHFNPQFLKAVNELGELADILYTDGGMGMSFQLQAKPVRNVVETTFILDGVTLEYFNQMESWQQFTWPGGTDHPGASLSWTSLKGGARLFGDYSGVWGLIRLFEQAQVRRLDDSNSLFELVLTAPDKLPLTWHLRTELGNGPLALLQLRSFKLPANIFDVGAGQALPYANAESEYMGQ
ncbi:type VI secretion protein VasK [Pseudomonas sp. GD04087]|uniref:ImcF-related family protein n=1 Tax=unclassified Pseudomonas TaxID=196821 RepID=UPI00244CF5CB|nr:MULTISPECIES: ImcF-related family protein [unclassified Pseudomonas]MDH0288556.1 type VI secretion protein VasK [Pseudomonas sp. GD04087]MDH1051644.1 type VI secretion protein VasK [Pseudomonas sp. GD03903]MDH2000584.1 type VI secretion protein VasK [Pseudomonas sp. GD03691]